MHPMSTWGRTVRTKTATITLVSDGFIEQRIARNARLTTAAIEKDRKARRAVSGGMPCAVMTRIPDTIPVEPEAANASLQERQCCTHHFGTRGGGTRRCE
ncbi:MAG: hypothetical protein IPI72_10675 [Flavobacteriales bacterium]|nr:hypothetical protein [Flavobacteriales bacterium]